MRKPQTRWTQDTETAFLLALRRTGAVQAAAAMIGRDKGAAYGRRTRSAGFAAKWDKVLAEVRAEIAAREAGADGVEAHVRYDGLSAVRKRAFLRALSETGEIQQACARVGVSQQTVWAVKKRSPDFAAACEKALRISLPCIEQIAYERAVEGWEEDIVVGGEVVGTRRRWSERLLADLLKAELAARQVARAADAKGGPQVRQPTREQVDASLTRKLDALAKRNRAQQRQAALAVEARWQAQKRAMRWVTWV